MNGLTHEKLKALRTFLGGDEELLQRMLEQVAQTDKELQRLGLTYKSGSEPEVDIFDAVSQWLPATGGWVPWY
jgi:hypothetical protein